MASNRHKSVAVALAVVGVAGLSLASAAQLQVTSDTLQAGAVEVEGCDEDGVVDVAYTSGWDSGAFRTTGIQVTEIDDACNTKAIDVVVTVGGDDPQVIELGGTLDASGSWNATFEGVPSEHVSDVAVLLAG